jgi:translation initiation factor 3 subunit C
VIENAEEWEDDEKPPGEKLKIPGSVVSYAERLDDELTRSLQQFEPHPMRLRKSLKKLIA